MPSLFRIMGGGQSHNNNNNNTGQSSSTAAAATTPQSSANPVAAVAGSSSASRSNSRYTYPGMRASVPTSAPTPVTVPPPSSSISSTTTTTMSSTAYQQHQVPASANTQTTMNHTHISLPTAPPRTGTMGVCAPPAMNPNATFSTPTGSTTGAPAAASAGAPAGTAPPATLSAGATVTADRPGAYQVTRTTVGPAQVYRVTVPPGVRPGAEFSVHAGPRRVRVRCPPNSRAGQSLQITLPPEPITEHVALKMAPLTAPTGTTATGGLVPMTMDVQRVNQQAVESGGTAQTFLITIPPNVHPGMQFTVNVNGQRFMVTCPPTAGPNQKVRIVPPMQREEPEAAPKTQVFEVAVPHGVLPGQPFALIANGQRVLVTCPPNVVSGQTIRFQLPVSQVVGNIQLSYESQKGGWRRTIRATDLKFQWVRFDNDADDGPNHESTRLDIDAMDKFDFRRSAYTRKLTYLEGNDARMRTGKLELVAANEAVVDSRLVVNNQTLLSYADITAVQGKPLEEKVDWFQKICCSLTAAWEDGHIKLVVRRRQLLLDSVDAVMSLGREDLRKRWRIEFLGEPAIDAGGVTREWFYLVTEQIFDPDFGLWLPSVNNQMCMNINPGSGVSCPDDHLIYFRFLGRVIGRALFDRQLIKGHMVRSIYKHLLGWPITFEDIKAQDEEYYQSLKKLTSMDDVSLMCLDFTVTEESMGSRTEIELIEGGAMKEVTNENLEQYLEANLRYRMLDRTKPQMTELLLGFFDIVPEPALTVFDANELELILCGLPEIDLDDWKRNTNYSGLFENKGKKHQVVEWFWQIVTEDFDQEMRARLLQFVTGTAGVPSRGFSVLQGNDGNIKKFTVHGVDTATYPYPRAHTCFNRIDLPNYRSKEDLKERITAAITLSGVGFDIE